jgi:transcriptional regulator
MYVPSHFAETNPSVLHEFIDRNSFGMLVSQTHTEPFVTHLPFLLDRSTGPHGLLLGHMAKANPHSKKLAGQRVLALFTGPHAYVSPTWYETENMVPTWNYTAVHVYGTVEVFDDAPTLLDVLRRSVQVYESGLPKPWTFAESTTMTARLLMQIVGFRIHIERIEGKWKLNQNHPTERRQKVVRALREKGDENSVGIADLMERT